MADKKISIFDPFMNAYREVNIEVAKKFIAQVEDVKAKIAKAETNG
jgi:hypothetical protein